MLFSLTGRSFLLQHIWRISFYRLTSFEARDYRVVFGIQKYGASSDAMKFAFETTLFFLLADV
jgi:hypothetical protein